ncbi:MAG TPA: hypothetical protein VMG82_28025 [Candidatus Sulfotelmatobacter sp.]|nr:hypothetical protein [Candidatus Sulfotelmatobacter sp.]
MEPTNIRFGGGATETLLHPLVAVWMLIAIVLILIFPRNKAIVPFLLAFFTIPLGQVIVVGGLHFPVLRILILAGLVRRATLRGELSQSKFPGGFNAVDLAVVLFTVSALAIVSLQWMELTAFIKFVGDFLDSLGGYLVVRFLIPDREAVWRTAKVLAMICLLHGACMVNEHFTRKDVFGYLGGVGIDSTVRDGHVRAGGVLGTIQSGAFAGPLIPVFLWLWTERKSRIAALAGLAGASAVVAMSFTSTSFMAYAAGLVGLAFWPLRKQMRLVRWGIVAMLAGLQLVMNGPVWSLIEHIDVASGSSSYHRYQLIDTLIRHFGEWWLLGTRNNGSWGWEMWDTCNQFVAVAVTGGLLTLIIYILILKRSFGAVGNARKQVSGNRQQEWFLWCLGSALFATVVAQFGINYMIQLQLVLFPLLACISVASSEIRQTLVGDVELRDQEQLASAGGTAQRGFAFLSAQQGEGHGKVS